ncbi:dienelactone hydrolase family protein [Uliginosibacterium gangwonense]|uniref:dienelactone hydrolase family protein n=1 Tax=Uliginosibacterium gangwonense TaxID=392736 RepID=UPI000378D867|nr:dienelactone hydrolase family protein [Uliginosibacterium gangwonense]
MNAPSSNRPVIGPEVIALYDEYTHAPLPRRVFMKRLTAVTGSVTAATALLPFLENNYAQAAVLPEGDARLATQTAGFASAAGLVSAYMAWPKAASGKLAAVIIIHENRGLNPHIQDITRRLALAGFLACAPDYLSGLGGTPADEDKARDLIAQLTPATIDQISLGALQFLKHHPQASGKCGALGFCWGGGAVNQLAVVAPDLDAGVAFYGMQPKAEEISHIKAPLLLHYAGLDERINAGIPGFESALKAAGKTYELHVYDGVNHAFNNDTNAARYDAKAATLAWQRTVEFLQRYLG